MTKSLQKPHNNELLKTPPSFHMLPAWVKHQIVGINIQTIFMVSRGVNSPHKSWCPLRDLHPLHMMTLNLPSSPPICYSKPQKCNYDKALDIVSSSSQSTKANLFTRLFTCPQVKQLSTSPLTHQRTPFKLYLLQESDQKLDKSTRAL